MPRKKPKNPVKAWFKSIDPVGARRVGGAALFIAVCGGIATGLALLAARVEERSRQSLQATPVRFEFDWPRGVEDESWLPEAFRADLRHLASLHMGQNDTLSPAPLKRLGEALEASGWFDDRPAIRREPGGRIHITGSWRVPVAAVRVLGNDLPISRLGKIMPIPYEVGQSDMPVIYGMRGLPPLHFDGSLDFATRWAARDLEAGLELLDLLRDQPYFGRITGIDVSEFAPGGGGLSILVDSGAKVRWGGGVRTFNPAEIPTPMKLDRLALLFSDPRRRIEDPTLDLELFHERGMFSDPPPLQGEG
jgi:hypothetical protein